MPSPAFEATSWRELAIPGVEIILDNANASPSRSWGVARLDGSTRELRGKAAFDAVRTRAGNDPTVLATLAMLFLDDGVSVSKPWTKVDGQREPAQQAIATSPMRSGDTLIYWRGHVQASELVRCRVVLSTGQVTCESGTELLQARRIGSDPAGTAKQDLASDDVYVRVRGIEALGHVQDDHAREQLIGIALHAADQRERGAAVRVLGDRSGAGVVAALSRVLLNDQEPDVRQTAAIALGKLRDPAGRDALERAARTDDDARVQVLASEALKQLK